MSSDAFRIPPADADALHAHLDALYPAAQAADAHARLVERLQRFAQAHPALRQARGPRVDERDVVLITYGDQVQEPGLPPLQSLDEFLTARAGDFLTGVHILPFFPYTSDDGFSVADYDAVSPLLGSWDHVDQIACHFRLMVDLVVNHVSSSHDWVKGFRVGDPRYTEYVVVVDPDTDLSMVVRPRALPLLTPVETALGVRHVWTTFSADQIDLNFANPDVLLDMTDVLLRYLGHGAQIVRLDAIAYLWKAIGTPAIHLPQTHRVVQFWRTVFDIVAPQSVLITETNVPHAENISYFGDGTNEAQLVYNFSLPPLTLHAFATGDARYLQRWAATLSTPSDQTTYFNFLASHDGIGVRPAEGILEPAERQRLVDLTLAHGGNVSFKTNADGSKSPYELNINYFDALNDPHSDEPLETQVDRFIASQAILLAMRGVPGIYVHSLFGSRGWPEGVAQTGRFRTINRQKWQRAEVERALDDPGTLRHRIFSRYRALIAARTAEPAFHPQGDQTVLAAPPALFSLLRTSPGGRSRVLCIHNVSAQAQSFHADLQAEGLRPGVALTDLVGGASHRVSARGQLSLTVPPHGVLWLRDLQP